MIIPAGYAHIVHRLGGAALRTGAAVTYGIAPNGGSFDPTDAALLHGFFGTRIMPRLTNGVQLESTIMKYGPNDTGPQVVHDGVVVGGISEATASVNTALLVQKRTALGGRANRGRFYLPGVPEAQVDGDGLIPSTYRASVETAVDGFLADIVAEGMNMVILHNVSPTPTIVTSLTVDEYAATQRRRMRR